MSLKEKNVYNSLHLSHRKLQWLFSTVRALKHQFFAKITENPYSLQAFKLLKALEVVTFNFYTTELDQCYLAFIANADTHETATLSELQKTVGKILFADFEQRIKLLWQQELLGWASLVTAVQKLHVSCDDFLIGTLNQYKLLFFTNCTVPMLGQLMQYYGIGDLKTLFSTNVPDKRCKIKK